MKWALCHGKRLLSILGGDCLRMHEPRREVGTRLPSRASGAPRELVAACMVQMMHIKRQAALSFKPYNRRISLNVVARPRRLICKEPNNNAMANDKKSHGLYCQKCRTPIDIDASIDQLNPAAFKLLTGMVSQTLQSTSC